MELLVLFFLIVLNGVFALSEMSVVASRKTRLQQWSDEGRPGASVALSLANEPSHFLSTIQIGITVIGILSGAFAGATIAKQLAESFSKLAMLQPHADTLALTIVVAGIAICSLIIGELAPKRIALVNPEAIASSIARPMQFFTKVTFPLVKAMSLATDGMLRLFGSKASPESAVTQEEIQVLMKQGAAVGVFDSHEQAMVSRVFRMDERRVTSVMTPRVDITYLDLSAPFAVNRDTLLQSANSRFPLCKGGLDEIIGIVHAKAMLEDALQDKPFDLTRHATKPLYIPEGLTITEVLEMFKKQRQHFALVLDEYGEIQGLVTMADIMEALVGDIGTVGEATDPDIVRRDDGSWLVDGTVAVQSFRDAAGLEEALPGEDTDSYNTVGGFVMMQLGRIPKVCDKFEAGGYRFEVIDMDRNRVDKLLISQGEALPEMTIKSSRSSARGEPNASR
jgi:putative hemolysin